MKTQNWIRSGRLLAIIAGTMDTFTGLGLVTFPAFTLHAMMTPVPGPEALVYVRFLGSFVGAVGLSYLIGLLWAGGRLLRPVFAVTLIFRLAAGGFTGVAVLQGSLGASWITVTITDLTLVALQSYLLMAGKPEYE